MRLVLKLLARRLMPWTSYPLLQEELSQVAAVLASDASDQSDLGHGGKALSYAVYGAKCPSLESNG